MALLVAEATLLLEGVASQRQRSQQQRRDLVALLQPLEDGGESAICLSDGKATSGSMWSQVVQRVIHSHIRPSLAPRQAIQTLEGDDGLSAVECLVTSNGRIVATGNRDVVQAA